MSIQPVAGFARRYSVLTPLFSARVPAGFPSPADDHLDKALDLNEYLIRHPAATFFCRVGGDSMQGIGIFDGDLLIIDRAIEPAHGDVVLAALDGELTCKVLDMHEKRLLSSNKKYAPIAIGDENSLIIEGVVTYSINQHKKCMR
ncbi:MAG: DNA polymerase V [Cellvibrionaceae bacterium]|jgi:DNA polymerase V